MTLKLSLQKRGPGMKTKTAKHNLKQSKETKTDYYQANLQSDAIVTFS